MSRLYRILLRLRALVRNYRLESEMDEELRFHLERQIEDNMKTGMNPQQARRAALLNFGGVEQTKEACRDMRGAAFVEPLWQDLRYGLRMLGKNPGFTAVCILTLALGTGANTAIFTVVNAVLLRPLPYPEPERIMQIGPHYGRDQVTSASEPKFLFWREQSQTFEAIAAYVESGFNLSGGDDPEFVAGLKASKDFFRVLGVEPAIGRSFTKEEDLPGGELVAILSDNLWRQRFGADHGLIGRAVSLNGETHTVIGVMAPAFRFVLPADVIVPLRASFTGDQDDNYEVIGRLTPGVTRRQALADMQLVVEKFRTAYPNRMPPSQGINVRQFQENLTADIRPLLLLLLGAVSFVLSIACANVANLHLARAAARQKEIAIRLALGARWIRIVRQLLTEGVLLSLAGGAGGLLLALWGVEYLAALAPEGLIPRIGPITVDIRVLVFTFATAMLTGLIFGIVPAIQGTRPDLNYSLKEGPRSGTPGVARSRLRGILVAGEIGLSLVLLIGAALLIRTFTNLRRVEPGFDPRNVLTFQVSVNARNYDSTAKIAEFCRDALNRIRTLPAAEATAITNSLPLSSSNRMPLKVEGERDFTTTEFRMITPEYFRVMRIALLRGRAFTEADTAGSGGVAIVNEAFARKYLSNANPLGQGLTVGRGRFGDTKPREIVGVVGDAKQFGLGIAAPPTVFVALPQVRNELMLYLMKFRALRFVVRTGGDPLALSAALKHEMLQVDPTLGVDAILSMEQVLAQSIALERFNMSLLGLFSGLGLILSAVGTYGVMSYSVAQRINELGVRMALGAQAGNVLRLVVGQGLVLAGTGVVLGLAAALVLTRLMSGLLFGVSASDPITFASVSLLLVAVAAMASYIPARRATKIDPMSALRHE